MSRFELLMDDMKHATSLCLDNKKIFLPSILTYFVIIIASIISGIILAFVMIGTITATISTSLNSRPSPAFILLFLFAIVVFAIIFGLTVTISHLGIIYNAKLLLNGESVSFKTFFQGIKLYAVRAIGGIAFMIPVGFFVGLILLIPIVIYTLTIGVLTGGLGVILLSLFFQSLIGYWLIIMVHDDDGPINSIKKNLSFGKNNLKIMILIFFIETCLIIGFPTYFGIPGAFVSFVFYAIIYTYNICVIMLTYRRYKKL